MGNKNYLLLIDIDKFAEVNEMYGRDFGDLVLSIIPERIKDVLNNEKIEYENKKVEYLERVGGDEYVLILKNINKNKATQISKKILNKISEPIEYNDQKIQITVSIGITEYSLLNKNSYNLAYDAMINAKREGRNNYKIV